MTNREKRRDLVSRSVRDGVPTEEILAQLRDEGAFKIDSIRVLCDSARMSLAQAKRVVYFSSTWSDTKEQDEKFWDELEAGLEDESRLNSGCPPSRNE